jgi:chromatin remodeling complex protein RSC6
VEFFTLGVMSVAAPAPRRESVFTRPTYISNELCDFFGVPRGTMLSRSDTTTRICAYAKRKNLLDKQQILRDVALQNLLQVPRHEELKILNLQRFLRPHYLNGPGPVGTTHMLPPPPPPRAPGDTSIYVNYDDDSDME